MNKNIVVPGMALGGMLLLTGCEASQSTIDATNGFVAEHNIDQQCVEAVESSDYVKPTDTAVAQACESVSVSDRVALRNLHNAELKSGDAKLERGFITFVAGMAISTMLITAASGGGRRRY